MKKNLLFPVLVVAVLLGITSCKNSGTTGLLVPEDAAIVFHVNNSSLSNKLSWNEIAQTNWFREMSSHAKDSFAQKLLADPSASGIDTKADFVVFVKKQGKNGYLVFEGSIKDAAAFETLNKKIHDGATSTKDGALSFMSLGENAALTWNGEHFAYVMGIVLPDMQMAMSGGRNEFDKSDLPADSLKNFGKQVLNLKKGDRLDGDKRFVSLIKDGSDFHIWMNSEKYYGDMFGPMLSMMGNFGALTKGNVSTGSVNFDNGKITMKSKQYYGKDLADFIDKYDVKPISADAIERIPSDNVMAVMAANYPPEGIKGFISFLKMDGLANMALMQTGLTLDDITKATKGELVLAFSDFSLVPKPDTVTTGMGKPVIVPSSRPDAKVLFATSVNDKAAFEKLLTIITEKMKEDPSYKEGDVNFKMDNNWFAAGNSADQVNQFLAGGSKKNALASKISGHPIGVYVDIRKIMQAASSGAKDSSDIAAINIAMNTWEEMTGWGGEFKNKASEFHGEITMVDKNTNSLKQLNSFIDKIATIYIDKKKKGNENTDVKVAPF